MLFHQEPLADILHEKNKQGQPLVQTICPVNEERLLFKVDNNLALNPEVRGAFIIASHLIHISQNDKFVNCLYYFMSVHKSMLSPKVFLEYNGISMQSCASFNCCLKKKLIIQRHVS